MTKKTELIEEKYDASVFVKIGRTKSLGNYETVRLDIGLTVPCKRGEIKKIYQYTKNKIEEWLDEELKKYERISNSPELFENEEEFTS